MQTLLQEIKYLKPPIIATDSLLEKSFTSFDTRFGITNGIRLYDDKQIFLEIIDHILIGGCEIEYIINPNIISNEGDYEIFYDLREIYNLIVDFSKSDEENSHIWICDRNRKDISDHKPIMTVINI